MRALSAVLLVLPFVALSAQQAPPPSSVEERVVAGQGLHYRISRPVGWKAGASYPVVVVITDAEREFASTVQRFIAARGNRPYVIVVPEMVTAGPSVWGAGQQQPFSYRVDEWARIRTITDCRFDAEGMRALIAEVRRRDAAAGSFYLTGWESGGHLVWSQFFDHPGDWAAIATVSPNYIGRCVDQSAIPRAPAGGGPPARLLYGSLDPAGVPGGILYTQWTVVQRIAAQKGFAQLSEQAVAGQSRGPMAPEVLAWFDSLRAAGSGGH